MWWYTLTQTSLLRAGHRLYILFLSHLHAPTSAVPAPQMRQIDTEEMRISLRSGKHLHWLNDLETGRLYWNWPRAVTEMLKPTFPGQLHRIQRNLFNVVGLIDPGSAEGIR